jgi:SsrA-binding protein
MVGSPLAKPTDKSDGEKLIVKNRRAFFDYHVEDRFEGGLVLQGSEVKSMRAGKVDLVDAYAAEEGGEVWLKQMYIAPFEQASAYPHEPRRPRKVLLHKHEIDRIHDATARGGFTVVPLRLYFKRGRVKVELGIGKGKKHFDKRESVARREAEREARGAVMRARKGEE